MDVKGQETVCTVPISLIDDFAEHPFQVRDDEDMERLIQSIDNNGVLNPVILRKNGERYELIAGHRRKHACLRLGISSIPAIVRELSRDEAVVEMVDSNLQREHILPSEKAYAYKMKMDAMKRKAGRPKENSTPMVSNLRTDEIIGEESGESREQVRRYIRLTELIPELLTMVDEEKIAFRPAVELSYLTRDEQTDLLETIESEDCTPSLAQAIRMKNLSKVGKLDMDTIFAIMTEQKPNQKEKIKIPIPALGDYDMDELETRVLQRYIVDLSQNGNTRTGKGLAPNSVNAVVLVLHASLTMAYALGLTKAVHVDKIKRPTVREKPVESFTTEEQKLIEQAVLSDRRPKMFGVVLCAYIRGCELASFWLLNGATSTSRKRSFM